MHDDPYAVAATEGEASHSSLNSVMCDAAGDGVAMRALSRKEDLILDQVLGEDADLLALIRESE